MKKSVFLSALILMFFFFSCFESFARIDLVYSKGSPAPYAFNIAKFSPNGKKIAAGLQGPNWDTNRFTKVIIYDASNGDSLMELIGHHGSVITSMTWINDSILASGDNDNEFHQKRTLILWNVNTGENLHTFFDSDSLYPWHRYVKNLVYLNGKNKLYVELFTDKRETINSHPPWEYVYWHDTVLVINTLTNEVIKPLSFGDTNDYRDISIECGAPDGSWYLVWDDGSSQLRNPDNDSIIWKSDSTFSFGFQHVSLNLKYATQHASNGVDIYNLDNRTYLTYFKFDSINNILKTLISPDSRYIAVTGYYENGDYFKPRFGVAEIENLSNQTWQDSIICLLSFDSSSDSLYILCLDNPNFQIYSAPWSPKNTKVVDEKGTRGYITLSPNPAFEYIEISVGSRHALSNTDIRIFNVFGEELLNSSDLNNSQFSIHNSQLRIDVSGLSSGVYFVRVGDRVKKFLKI